MKAIKIITDAVASEFNVALCDLYGKSQKSAIVLPRHIVFYLSRQLTPVSYPVMARPFGKHHSSVMSAVLRIQAQRLTDSTLHCLLSELEARLQEPLRTVLAEAVPEPVHSKLEIALAVSVPEPILPVHSKATPIAQSVTRPSPPPSPRPKPARIRTLEAAFDPTDRPSAGTACAWCAQDGHWCPATGFSAELALCEPCARQQPCAQAEAVKRLHSGIDATERITVSGLAPIMTVRRSA